MPCRGWPATGTEVTGDIGDLEPLTAIRDALNLGRYEEIIVSTLPLGVSRWLKRDLVSRAQAFGLSRRASRRRNPAWGVKTAGSRTRLRLPSRVRVR